MRGRKVRTKKWDNNDETSDGMRKWSSDGMISGHENKVNKTHTF